MTDDKPATCPHTARPTREADWDPWSPTSLADPHAAQAAARERCPFPFATGLGGFRSVMRYADIVKVAQDTKHFKNGLRPKMGRPSYPLESDPPVHTAYRRLLQPFFSPVRMRKLEDRMRAFSVELLMPVLARGSGDLATEFSFILPVRAFCFLLGLNDAHWPQIRQWSEGAYSVYAHMPERAQAFREANDKLFAYAHEVLAERRAHPRDPAEDIVTMLTQAVVDDAPIPDDIIVGIMRLLLTAGHESTTSTLGNCMLYLARHPEAQAALRADPSKIPAAIEEILRWDTPVMGMPRVVSASTEVAGEAFEPGDHVYLLFSSGNRDAARFPDPDTCMLDRKPNPHLAFGIGVHTCMGAPMARVEIKAALEELLARTTSFELQGEAVRTIFHRRGVMSLPVRLTRA